jgi:hypothetical protein
MQERRPWWMSVVITGYHRKSVLRALNRSPISADGDDISAEPHRHHRCR